MRQVYAVAAALLLGFSACNVFAETAKTGVVDLQKIIQTSKQMKAIQQKLEKDFKPRRDKLITMENEIKKDVENFKKDSAVMSQTQKKELESKIIAKQQNFERDGQQYQKELSTAHNEAMEDLYRKIRQAIQVVAEKEKYDLIIQKDAAPYNLASLDITTQVMKAIN